MNNKEKNNRKTILLPSSWMPLLKSNRNQQSGCLLSVKPIDDGAGDSDKIHKS